MNRHAFISAGENPVLNPSSDSEGSDRDVKANSTVCGLPESQLPVGERNLVRVIEPIPIVLSESRLLNNFHDGDSSKISKRTKRLIHKAVEETLSVINPRGMYRIMPFGSANSNTVISGDVTFSSKYLSRILKDCDRMVVFAVTIGKRIDNRIKKKIDRFPSYAYILDYVAAAAAEETAQVLQRLLRETLPSDKTVTYRYSPGYCDWPLNEQVPLLQTIPHKEIGLELSDSCLMSPRKSVSGVFGVCSSELGINAINHCTKCHKKNCSHRRK